MFPNRRGTETPVARQSVNTTGGVYTYNPVNDTPFPAFLRTQPDYHRYPPECYHTQPTYLEPRHRGFSDRPSGRRYMPYNNYEGGMNGIAPVRTVPTSITVPPSKQRRNSVHSEIESHSEVAYNPYQPQPTGYLRRAVVPMQDPGLAAGLGTPQPTGVQKFCALLIAHCANCKTEDCVLGDACRRVKTLWRHILHCDLKDRCSMDRCFAVKKELAHFNSCHAPQCPACTHLKALVQDFRRCVGNSRSNRLKREAGDGPVANLLPQERVMRPSPVRKTHYTPQLDPFPVDDRLKREFGGELETDSSVMTPGMNNSFFMEPSETYPLDSYSPLPQPTATDTSKPVDQATFQLGVSLFETFEPAEIEEYLKAVRGSDAVPMKPDALMKDKICAVCFLGEQTFQPIQLYCDCCCNRIKRAGAYWKSKQEAKLQICVCTKCFAARKNGELTVGQMRVPHAAFRSGRNDECVTEPWVACDKCGYWVHASCGLFNRGENNDSAKYMCPFCLKEEMELGHRTVPHPKPVSMYGATELPNCPLSDFIQARVNRHILEEISVLRLPRGIYLSLTVRVLMSTKKVTKLQPAAAASFPDLPVEYPYRQRVIGVFQKIHGVDVLLFCLYVQEYGDDCPRPNQRWVNLEYIDSVKHFTPEVKTARGEPLRSVVYKETLLAYIEFVKRWGFEVFYIWVCPPGKEGEDYILHCKPKTQRIPSADRLRIWYKDLLKSAKERRIVTHDSNLMDTFFTFGNDRAAGRPFSAAEMPYFEGDYWPGAAERILEALRSNRGIDFCKKPGEKRKTRGEMSLNEVLENGLIVSLPFPRWSDFMVWHLQEPCSLCQTYITHGTKYVYHFGSTHPKQTESLKRRAHFEGIKLGRPGAAHSNIQFFQICETCYQTCAAIGEGGPIPDCVNFSELEAESVSPVTAAVGDNNNSEENRFSEIFESRQAFLAFCKGNHYQFDTLQHAKHSTMMLLYHLHNINAPVFPTLCAGCGMEIPMGADSDKRDPRRPEFCRVCRANGSPHLGVTKAVNGPLLASANGQAQFMRTAENFEHAAYCRGSTCYSPECRRMKHLFRHVQNCRIGAEGSCQACRFYAVFLERHAHFCNRQCLAPNCDRIKAVRKHRMRLDQEHRRRAYDGEVSHSSSSS